MSQIKWLPAALADIERLDTFLRPKSSEAAARAIRGILEQVEALRKLPDIGRPMLDQTGRRELIVPFSNGAYVVRYMREDDQDAVVIIRVWHGREQKDES